MKESNLLSKVKSLLDELEQDGQLTYTRIHVAGIPRGKYRGRTKNVEMAGMADIEIISKGRVFYCETKHPNGKGRLTDSQKAFKGRVTLHGAPYLQASKIEDLILFLMKHGIEIKGDQWLHYLRHSKT